MDLGLTDKVAIITGSSRGLGLASAKALAAEGCHVTLCGRTEATLLGAAREVASIAGGDDRVLAVRADLTQAEGVQRVIDDTVQRFGGLDVLVNNIGLGRGGGLLETSDAEWQEAFDQTLLPAVRASRLAVPHMTRRGAGSIIIIASVFGREAGGRMTYNAIKAAEISLAKSLAQQLASANIRVNSVPQGRFCSRVGRGGSGSRTIRRRSLSSSSENCHSAASAALTKSAMSSRSSLHRAPVGSAARRSWWTAVRVERSSGRRSNRAGSALRRDPRWTQTRTRVSSTLRRCSRMRPREW